MTISGTDPATFRFAAQCLNHCATACPQEVHVGRILYQKWQKFSFMQKKLQGEEFEGLVTQAEWKI
jgi:hypothetical protein